MNTEHFKQKLEKELGVVGEELSNIATKNPNVNNGTTDWEAKSTDGSVDTADDTELGDKIEEFEENTAVTKDLEIRYNDIKAALAHIEAGTYGICEVCGEKIEEDRLEANPAARTCKAHMNG